MFIQTLQFQYYKEPPAQLNDIMEQPLKNLKHTFYTDYEHLPLKFRRLRITTQNNQNNEKTTPKSSRSVSPLKKVYLGSSLVARRKLTGYIKPRKSPDPYGLKYNQKPKSPRSDEGMQTLTYKNLYLLQKYGF